MTLISWTDEAGVFQVISVDATMSERHSADADVTEDPVEAGANATDNVRQKARTLALDIFVSDQQNVSGFVLTEVGRADKIFKQLETLQAKGQRLTINLGGVNGFGRQYTEMVIVNASTTRTSKSGRDSLDITASFKKIVTVNSEIVAVQKAKEPKGKKKINGGDQNPKPASPPDQYESNLFRMFVKD